MNKEDALKLLKQGRDSWNEWARELLEEQKKLRDSGEWVESLNSDDWNEATKTWQDKALVDFREEQLVGIQSISEFVFPGRALFDSAVFVNGAVFIKSKFLGEASFKEAEFEDTAIFDEAEFSEGVSFYMANFTDMAVLNSAKFLKGVSFSRARVLSNIYFEQAKFCGQASFAMASISGNASFTSTEFLKEANFSGIRISGLLDFQQSKVSGEVKFDRASIDSAASFRKVKFERDASLDESIFLGDVFFNDAIFASNVSLNEASFKESAYFNGSTFSGCAYVMRVDFSGYAHFTRSKFCQLAYFSGCTFRGPAYFGQAKFLKGANFSAIRTESFFTLEDGEFSEAPSFYQSKFLIAPIFGGVDIPKPPLFEIKDRFRSNYDRTRAWGALKQMARQAQEVDLEYKYYKYELKTRPLRRVDDWLFWLFGLLYWMTSSFGRSVFRPMVSWALSVIVFGLLYQAVHYSTMNGLETGVSGIENNSKKLVTQCSTGESSVYYAALGISLRNATLMFDYGPTSRGNLASSYLCLYGTAGSPEANLAVAGQQPEQYFVGVPRVVIAIEVIQHIVSTLFIFLFLLAIRNFFKVNKLEADKLEADT